MIWNPDCTGEPCICPGTEVGTVACAHCGEPLSATHRRRWPEATVHATCASDPVVDGVCPHAACCCGAHKVETPKAKVILFKPGGKYYTEEEWAVPTVEQVLEGGGTRGDSAIPYCMRFSPDFRRIDGGSVLVDTQEPWGYPHLIPVDGLQPDCPDHKLVQHRDGKPRWCNTCGRGADGQMTGRAKVACPNAGCPGDGRYTPPGRGHTCG